MGALVRLCFIQGGSALFSPRAPFGRPCEKSPGYSPEYPPPRSHWIQSHRVDAACSGVMTKGLGRADRGPLVIGSLWGLPLGIPQRHVPQRGPLGDPEDPLRDPPSRGPG
jgi:hypothetical protein